jgi:hypothetical protein
MNSESGEGSQPQGSTPERHPLNASGPFYVEKDMCLICGTPEAEAPDLIHLRWEESEPDLNGCYFKKQPETPEELGRAIEAMRVACCGAYRYGGHDPDVIRRLRERGVDADQIDCLCNPRSANEDPG